MTRVPVQISTKPSGLEWPNTMSAADLRAGVEPVALREFILKVHSRCNLSCDYCYIYEMADTSWSSMPFHMPHAVVVKASERIAEHALRHSLKSVHIILHGGEPLLVGRQRLANILETIRARLVGITTLRFSIQTNGMLLSDESLGVLSTHDVKIGVSLDGGRHENDRHRHQTSGRGSYEQVAARLDALRQGPHKHLYAGLLAVVDIENDPIETYEALLEFAPPAIDLLLPHGNWTAPPPRRRSDPSETPYADWLVAVFDHWYGAPERATRIRLFEQIMRLFFGHKSRLESIGLSPVATAVIDTDGSFEQVDTLKSTFDGAVQTGMNVFDHDLDAVLAHPSVAARQLGEAGLCEICRRCPLGYVCGGGYFPHRYSAGSGFLNPSVYCSDLFALITHIGSVLVNECKEAGIDVAARTASS